MGGLLLDKLQGATRGLNQAGKTGNPTVQRGMGQGGLFAFMTVMQELGVVMGHSQSI